jgi:hypothetical protein
MEGNGDKMSEGDLFSDLKLIRGARGGGTVAVRTSMRLFAASTFRKGPLMTAV